MWSVGVILYVLMSGSPPFTDENQSELFRKIRMGEWTFESKEEWKEISDKAKDLIRGLLVTNPVQRLTAEQALQCNWFKDEQEEKKHAVESKAETAKHVVPTTAPSPPTAKEAFNTRKSRLKNTFQITKGKSPTDKTPPAAEVSLDPRKKAMGSLRTGKFEI